MEMRLKLTALVFMLLPFLGVRAQDVALKSNLVSDAFLSPAVGLEVGIAPKWSIDISGQFNLWTVGDGHKWRHWLVQPEARYWFCRRFIGHFMGVHLLGGEYNIGKLDLNFKFLGTDFRNLRDRRYEGWGAGAGIAYGYAWAVHPRWNIEAEIGIGWVYTRFSSYPCAECGTRIEKNKPHNYIGPTKAAVNIVYFIK